MTDPSNGDTMPIMHPTSEEDTPLMRVREGMHVRDSGGDRIGTVRRVKMGGNDPVDARRQAAEVGLGDAGPGDYPTALLNDVELALSFENDDIPREERQRLINQGYIQIDSSGIFTADRFATPDQVARVEGDTVHLNVAGDMLAKSR